MKPFNLTFLPGRSLNKIVTLFFCTTVIWSSNAQSDFRKGYIVNNDNDTIHGLIDYKGNKANAQRCVYKKENSAILRKFSPSQIKSYRFIDSKYYVSKSVENGNEAPLLFLEYLVNGIIDVYYYRNDEGEHYLIDDGSGKLYELKDERKEVVVDDVQYFRRSKEYIGVLKATFKDSPEIIQKVDKVKLNHQSLVDISHDYHDQVCSTEECLIYERKSVNKEKAFGLVVGANVLSLVEVREFTSDFLPYLINSDFGQRVNFSFGVFYKSNLTFWNERLYFQYEGTYASVNLETSHSYSPSRFNPTAVHSIELSHNTFNNLLMLKYEFPNGKFRPTFQAGCFWKFLFGVEYRRESAEQFVSGGLFNEQEFDEYPFSNTEFGLNVGAGLKTYYQKQKEMYIDLRYQRGLGYIEGLHTNNFSLNLGFEIGK